MADLVSLDTAICYRIERSNLQPLLRAGSISRHAAVCERDRVSVQVERHPTRRHVLVRPIPVRKREYHCDTSSTSLITSTFCAGL
jgi:hypothetical protein